METPLRRVPHAGERRRTRVDRKGPGAGTVDCGIGLLIPRTARLAAWGLVALLLAMFPANIYVAISGTNAAGLPSSPWYTWSRLPFQLVFIWWVLAAVRGDGRRG